MLHRDRESAALQIARKLHGQVSDRPLVLAVARAGWPLGRRLAEELAAIAPAATRGRDSRPRSISTSHCLYVALFEPGEVHSLDGFFLHPAEDWDDARIARSLTLPIRSTEAGPGRPRP